MDDGNLEIDPASYFEDSESRYERVRAIEKERQENVGRTANGFEDLTHGQALFLSIISNVEEVLNKLNEVSTKPYQQRPTKCSYHI